MTISIGRLVRRALFAVLILEGLYVVSTGVFLNTFLSSRLFNRRPERFHIRWTLAASPWPGLIHLTGVQTGGRSRVIDWDARIGSVTASFHSFALFGRDVKLDWVRAKGVDYRQRPRALPGETPGPGAGDWPVIPAAPAAGEPAVSPEPAAGSPGSRPRHGPPWTVRAARILCDTRQVWIGRYRVTGPGRVDARMNLVARGPLEFPRFEYRLTSGDLWVGEDKLFEDFRLLANLRVAPYTPAGNRSGKLVQSLSGDVDADARGASLAFLDFYFRRMPEVRFSRRGPARVRMRLDAGRLLPGSWLELGGDRIEAAFWDQRLTGSGHVRGEVRDDDGTPRSHLEAVLDDFQIARAGHAETYAHGRGFRIVATSASLDLADPFDDLHVVIDLPEASVPDLSVYNSYFPSTSRVSILSGTGRLAYHLEADPGRQSLRGRMDFAMSDAAIRFEDLTLEGNVRIAAPLRAGNGADLPFDISGTRIEITSANPTWKGLVRLPVSKMRFTEPMQVQARARLELQDTRPLVAAFDAYRDLPRIVERLMTISDVRGTADFEVGKDSVAIRNLEVEGKGFRSLADLRFGSRGRDGILYLRLHGFSLGVDLSEGKKDFKFLRPLRWFEAARAGRRAAPARNGGAGPEGSPR